ncbi:MAG: ATP-binding protein [Lentisphaeria bacterium]|nr:ATP-binding protein [Lentisphaeria bacterium]
MEHFPEQQLRDIVYRGIESDELDYKAAQSWNALSRAGKGKIIRHLIALANTKGGYVVIGVGEDAAGKPALYTGVSDEESASFDPSAVGTFVNRCVEPPIDFTIERPVIDGKRFVVFAVKPFRQLPHVCCNSVDTELSSGVFYIRTPEASSRPATRAVEMQQLIQRAMRNQREQLAKVLRGILYESGTVFTDSNGLQRFNELIVSSSEFFKRHKNISRDSCILQISVIPENFDPVRFDLQELRRAAAAAWRWQPGSDFFAGEDIRNAYFTNVSLRFMAEQADWMWQLYKSGLFHCTGATVPGRILDGSQLIRWTCCITNFIGRLYSELNWQEEQPTLRIELFNVENMELKCDPDISGMCRIDKIEFEFKRSAADLAVGSSAHAARIIRGIGERFNLNDSQINQLLAQCTLWSDPI